MGVRVSTASLAAAAAECGAAGTIAGVGLGYGTAQNERDYYEASKQALTEEIRKAKKATKGVVGVNVMVALANYDDLARTASAENADFIASGAGLPLNLPALVANKRTKLIPIISSARAGNIIIKTWQKRFNRLPDALIVEGPMAGGHLGFKLEELVPVPEPGKLEAIVDGVIGLAREYRSARVPMPVIAAGGVYDGRDMARFLRLGCGGVQVATRFVATPECSVADAFKQLYLKAGKEDVVIIKSPVGMPGRAIRTQFIEKLQRGERIPFECGYQCLRSCDPDTAPYCIAQAMFNAAGGKTDEAVVFCGSNVWRINEIVPVRKLIDTIVAEAEAELAKSA